MTSFATVRDPIKDHLLTPQNAALVIIDYQPVQVSSIASRSKRELVATLWRFRAPVSFMSSLLCSLQ
jgi:hypothetical protein